MDHLYAPWRSDYTKSIHGKDARTPDDQCAFCHQFSQNNDEQFFIIKRFDSIAVMLNKYPYNAGHILLLPLEHKAHLNDLSRETRIELMELTNHSVEIVKNVLGCHGVNVGLNLGKAAGAGIPSHLHMHVLPRFTGDTNFMPVLADTKTISLDMNDIFNKLKPAFTHVVI